MKILGVIPSVPARVENLVAMVQMLREQTLPLTRLVVFLNGYGLEHVPLDLDADVIDWSAGVRGPGIRWRYAAASDADLVVSLDDDFDLNHTYVERSVAALFRTQAGMVTWTGNVTRRRYLDLGADSGHDYSLWAGGSGTATVWAKFLRGIERHPWADRCLGVCGDEEAVLSLYLWQQGQTIVRPSGRPPLRHVMALQYATTASHRLHGRAWDLRRQQMMNEYRWG